MKSAVAEASAELGEFINAIFSFVMVATVVYWLVVVPTNRLMDLMIGEAPTEPPATKTCPECLSKVPAAATRCAFCTVPLSAMTG